MKQFNSQRYVFGARLRVDANTPGVYGFLEDHVDLGVPVEVSLKNLTTVDFHPFPSVSVVSNIKRLHQLVLVEAAIHCESLDSDIGVTEIEPVPLPDGFARYAFVVSIGGPRLGRVQTLSAVANVEFLPGPN